MSSFHSLNVERRSETLSTGGWPISNCHNFGCPIFGASFAPTVGIRALREPSPRNSPRFAEPNRRYYYNGKIIRTLRVA
jgi:hypothetical protein